MFERESILIEVTHTFVRPKWNRLKFRRIVFIRSSIESHWLTLSVLKICALITLQKMNYSINETSKINLQFRSHSLYTLLNAHTSSFKNSKNRSPQTWPHQFEKNAQKIAFQTDHQLVSKLLFYTNLNIGMKRSHFVALSIHRFLLSISQFHEIITDLNQI